MNKITDAECHCIKHKSKHLQSMKDMSGIFVILVLMFCSISEVNKTFKTVHFPLQQQLTKKIAQQDGIKHYI
jgi:hypothetical protein